jgi:SNF2 family DNA or RNA helicase
VLLQGSGCILAHCMGLGKTLTVIAFTATLLTNPLVQSIEDPYQPGAASATGDKAVAKSSSSSSSGQGAAKSATAVRSDGIAAAGAADASPAAAARGTSAVTEPDVSTAEPTATPTAAPTAAPAASQQSPFAAPASSSATSAEPVAAPTPKKQLIRTVLIVAPVNTLDNWLNEYKRWTPAELYGELNVTSIMSVVGEKAAWGPRLQALRRWHEQGGVMVMGYDMYRRLTNPEASKVSKKKAATGVSTVTRATGEDTSSNSSSASAVKPAGGALTGPNNRSNAGGRGAGAGSPGVSNISLANIQEARRYLQDPGPDLVVADEAHTIKEPAAIISKVMNQIRTKRRIALTGSPLQNNLVEYWCMVNWVKYRFLGDYKEFYKYYVEPIRAGSDKKAVSSEVTSFATCIRGGCVIKKGDETV